MKFQTKIHPTESDMTLSMHMFSTTPYNADCDGDEMNLFVPQSDAAKSDVDELMDLRTNILNENGHVQIYPIQNVMLALYMLTRENSSITVPRRFFHKRPRWGKRLHYTGYEFVSNPLPESFSCKGIVVNGMVTVPLTKSVMKTIIKELYMIDPEVVTVYLHELGMRVLCFHIN
jgi:hypothetical protein